MVTNENNASGAPLGAGDTVGKYEIKDVLGTGGQAIVYKAYDAMLDRFVAIKQIASNLAADEQYMESLQANVRTLAKLGQRNEAIVTIHEVIQDERGLFYVMEFVEGHTLETILRETDGPTEPKAALLVLFRLAAALHEVHSAGIVHRDIKPSNIILTEGLRPKIIDFGVAASTDAQRSMPLATTKYLAPEIYEGGKVDGRADIYSLGFLAYELLLGRPKFNEVFEDIVRDKHSESLRWMKWHGNESVKAPALHEVNPSIPLGLSRIVERMMAKRIEDRFSGTEELGVAIKRSFKPRGRAAAGAAVGAPVGASAGQAKMAQLSQSRGLGTLEDEALEVVPPMGVTPPGAALMDEGPETAPLPKQPMSKRTKIGLGALAAVGLIALVVVGVAKYREAQRIKEDLAHSAANLYRDARTAYKNEQFDQALALHREIEKKHPRSTEALQGTVYIPMCEAHVAIAAGQWDQAQVAQAEAEAAATKIQQETDESRQDLIEWTRVRLDDIAKIGQKAYSYQVFSEAMAHARTALQRPPSNVNEFNEITRGLEREIGQSDVNLTPQQAAAALALKNDVERGRFLWEVRRHMADGDQQLKRGQYDRSEKAYRNAEAMLTDGKDDAAKLLPTTQTKSLQDDIAKQLAAVRKGRGDKAFDERMKKAKDSGNTSEEARLIRKILGDKNVKLSAAKRKEFERRLQYLDMEDAMAKARLQFKEKNFDAAKVHLKKVLAINSKHAEANTMLKEIDQTKKRSALVKAADAAYAKREFAKALPLYEQAAAIKADAHVTDQLRDCRYQIEIAKAADFIKKGAYDKALECYNEAKRIQPAMTAQVDSMIAMMQKERQYREYLTKGDEALGKSRWAEALEWYGKAKTVKASAEIEQRIKETHYQKYLADGKAAMTDGNIPLARWNFTRAQRYKDTEEIKELLKTLAGMAKDATNK